MDIKIADKGAFSWALVQLEPADVFVSEAGAMFRASSNIDISVPWRPNDTASSSASENGAGSITSSVIKPSALAV